MNVPRVSLYSARSLMGVMASWGFTDQLFVFFGDHHKGALQSKDRLDHWVRE